MKIGIIGAGKVGIAMGYVMRRKGLPVAGISDNRKEPLRLARDYLGDDCLYTANNLEVVASADAIAITTQDRAIKGVVAEIDQKARDLKGKVFFHTSGSLGSDILSPLAEKGGALGSLHPLQTFPDIDSAIGVLPDTYIFIEGGDEALPVLETLGSHIGCRVVVIEAKDKVLYHLAAVFVCNLLCALLYSGEGIMEKIETTLEPFFPIIRATLQNIEQKGTVTSLTGPIVRGDVDTIRAHVQAMGDMKLHKNIYGALSRVALEMADKRGILDQETIAALRHILEEDVPDHR
jgi:predicted short-subunit dehydrogenase-like oxidoreductase (DUF2520 family)